jgi:hypothetical protein
LVWSNLTRVGVALNDPTSQWNDVPREVDNEVDVVRVQKICPKERFKVRTQKSRNFVAGTGEVHSDQFLVVAFVGIQKDIAKGGRAGLGGYPQDDENVTWEGAMGQWR